MAYQARLLVTRPGFAAAYPKAIDALDEAINGDASVPPSQRPAWLRDQMALQIGRDPEKRSALLLRNSLPVGDAYEMLGGTMGRQGVMDFAHYFGGGLSPVLKALPELAAGRELFTRRDIGATELEGDVGLVGYLAGQVRPLREFGVGTSGPGGVQRSFQQGIGQGVARLGAGGRVQSFGDERRHGQLLRDFTERERRIQTAIRRAEANSNREASIAGRVELMSMYQRMIEVGLSDEVPKHAREFLSSYTSAQQE